MSEDTTRPSEPVEAEPQPPAVDGGAAGKGGWLDRIERLGNKVPHPAIIFGDPAARFGVRADRPAELGTNGPWLAAAPGGTLPASAT